MANTINATSTGAGGLITTGDDSGVLNIQTNETTAISIDASQAVSFTNAPTVTGGTANGVAYLNGSKVLTTGSALTFSGSALAVTGSISSTGGFTSNTTITAQLDGSDSAGAGPGFNLFNTAFSRGWRTQLSASNNKVDYYFNGSAYVAATTIDTSGNFLVGTTNSALATANANIVVNGSSSSQIRLASGGVVRGSFVFDGTSNVLYSNTGSTRLYCISNTGGVYLSDGSTAWASNSDERLKDIIEPIENATEKLANWRTVIGKYKTDEEGTRRSFLIAQDIRATFPEAVDASEPEKLGVQYSDLIPVLVKAIQEQQALIIQLQADVAALKGA